MSNNELREHKRSDKIKWILTGTAFVFLFVMLIGMCLQLFGTGKVKPSEWFKKPDTEQTQPGTNENKTPETAVLSLTVPRYAAKTMSATVDNENGIQPYAETFATSNIENYNGSYMDFVSDLGGGVYRVHNTTFSMAQSAYGAGSFVATDGINEKTHSSSSFRTSCFLYYSYSNSDDPYGKAVLRFSACTPSDFGLSSNAVLQEIQLMFSEYDGYRTITPKVYKCTNGYITDIYDGNAVSIVKFVYRVPVSLPANPVKEGHTFAGWYYDSAFTRPYDNSPIYSDTQLYAKFEINRYTVTFNSDGGSSVESQTVNWNTAVSLTTPTRDRYAFKGWFLPNGTQYTNQPIKSNTTLTAHWERNVFTITFNSDGGSEVSSQDVMLNEIISLTTPMRIGYTFKGWFTADGKEYTNQSVTDDMTLTAHWEVIMCTVTFYVDGEIYDTKTVEYGTPLITVIETANELNLAVLSVCSASGSLGGETLTKTVVTDDSLELISEELTGTDKVINTVKNNKWAVIGGVAGGVALIAILGVVISGTKRRKR